MSNKINYLDSLKRFSSQQHLSVAQQDFHQSW